MGHPAAILAIAEGALSLRIYGLSEDRPFRGATSDCRGLEMGGSRTHDGFAIEPPLIICAVVALAHEY